MRQSFFARSAFPVSTLRNVTIILLDVKIGSKFDVYHDAFIVADMLVVRVLYAIIPA